MPFSERKKTVETVDYSMQKEVRHFKNSVVKKKLNLAHVLV